MKLLPLHIACASALCLGLSACGPDAPPVDEPPEPQVAALADALHEPMHTAVAVDVALQGATERQKAAVEAAAF